MRSPLRSLAAMCVALGAASSCTHERVTTQLVECPAPQPAKIDFDAAEQPIRSEVDANRDGKPDQIFHFANGKVHDAELDLNFDGQADLLVEYDEQGRVASWHAPSHPSDLDASALPGGRVPNDPPPADLARLIPGFEPPIGAECVERAEVKTYIEDVRQRMYRRWDLTGGRPGSSVAIRFSLDQSGVLLGACLASADDREVGASAIRALYRSAPFPSMPERAQCLARRNLRAAFHVTY